MTKHRFTQAEHFAVWHTYSGICFWCGHPLRLRDATIDHVIAESLGGDREEFAELKKNYSLPVDFEVNDFRNWVPACSSCNTQKGQRIYAPSVAFLGVLEKTCRHGVDAKREAERIAGNKRKDQLLGRILAAIESDASVKLDLEELLTGLDVRKPVLPGPLKPLTLDNTLEIVPGLEGDKAAERIRGIVEADPRVIARRKAEELKVEMAGQLEEAKAFVKRALQEGELWRKLSVVAPKELRFASGGGKLSSEATGYSYVVQNPDCVPSMELYPVASVDVLPAIEVGVVLGFTNASKDVLSYEIRAFARPPAGTIEIFQLNVAECEDFGTGMMADISNKLLQAYRWVDRFLDSVGN